MVLATLWSDGSKENNSTWWLIWHIFVILNPMHLLTKSLLILPVWLLTSTAIAQSLLYSRAFGKETNDPVIFLHGGPGSSSVYFEATTAQMLADQGFYVIIYDRRGEGRSKDPDAKMNYDEFFQDLNSIFEKYRIKRSNLIGFSFGGLVTTLYAEKYPEKVKSIVLTSALISQQASYNTILNSVESIYTRQKDTASIHSVVKIRKMDTHSLPYRTEVFNHASRNGFFSLQEPDSAAALIYSRYNSDKLITSYVKNEKAVEAFWKNEKLKNIDITPALKKLIARKIPVYAVYGKQDGLYSEKQIADLRLLVGEQRLKYLDNCSHTVFVDQQSQFIGALSGWLKENLLK